MVLGQYGREVLEWRTGGGGLRGRVCRAVWKDSVRMRVRRSASRVVVKKERGEGWILGAELRRRRCCEDRSRVVVRRWWTSGVGPLGEWVGGFDVGQVLG